MKKCTLCLLLILLCHPVAAAEFEWADVPRVVVVGDIHGAYEPLLQLLRGNQLIDTNNQWIGGDTHLVSLGDLLDRGDQGKAVLDLFMALQPQAQAAGGLVHVLLGNHELMNLTGDWRDVTPADIQSFADKTPEDALEQRRGSFYRFGTYGNWLLQRPVLIKINDWVFAHGGLPSLLLEGSLAHANDSTMNLLKSLVVEGEQLVRADVLEPGADFLKLAYVPREEGEDLGLRRARGVAQSAFLGERSPLWYRGSSLCHAVIEADLTTAVLKKFNASAVVVGHSPTWNHQVRRRMAGQVWAIDTGMLNSVYHGEPMALEIVGEQVQVRNSSGEPVAFENEVFEPTTDPAALPEALALAAATAVVAAEQPTQERPRAYRKDRLVDLTDHSGSAIGRAWFRPLGKRDAAKEVAAYRLDRLLGLGLVPTTALGQLEGKKGILQRLDSDVVTERQRKAQGLSFPNWCDRGNNYQAVAAFDALVGQRERSSHNLAYEARLTRIRLTDHSEVLGTSKRISKSKTKRYLSETLRARLHDLNRDQLRAVLKGLLAKREITALLKRRDAIVQWPEIPKP